MPYIQKRRYRVKDGTELTPEQIEYLLIGMNLLDIDFPFNDEDHMRRVWQDNKDYIMSLRDNPAPDPNNRVMWKLSYKPGTKPWAWENLK